MYVEDYTTSLVTVAIVMERTLEYIHYTVYSSRCFSVNLAVACMRRPIVVSYKSVVQLLFRAALAFFRFCSIIIWLIAIPFSLFFSIIVIST